LELHFNNSVERQLLGWETITQESIASNDSRSSVIVCVEFWWEKILLRKLQLSASIGVNVWVDTLIWVKAYTKAQTLGRSFCCYMIMKQITANGNCFRRLGVIITNKHVKQVPIKINNCMECIWGTQSSQGQLHQEDTNYSCHKNIKSNNGITKFTDYSENTCPGGNKSGASVSIILSTSSLAVFCKACTAGKKKSWNS